MFALTFDDGLYQYTSQLLDTLQNFVYNGVATPIRATFFINGANYVDITTGSYPAILSRMKTNNHMIASHTYSHQDLSLISTQAAYEQIWQLDVIINNLIGVIPRYVRPPYGAGISNENSVLTKLGSWGKKVTLRL
jgi:peptidoglycan/xylan/chitin deacetylase (PgdA/CDA1 family)